MPRSNWKFSVPLEAARMVGYVYGIKISTEIGSDANSMETATITMFTTLVATSGVFTLFLSIFSYLKRKELPGGRLFLFYTASLTIYIFAVAFEWTSDSLAEIKAWTVVEYLGIAFAPPLGLLVVLLYIGKNVPSKAVAALFAIPALTFAMVATNDWHHWFYKDVYLRPDSPAPLADVVVGEWYVVHGAYTFGCLLASVVLLVRQWGQTNKAFRLQLATLIVGQLLPMIGAFVYLMGVTPYGIDPVPMVLCITSGLYLWAMAQSRFLTIVPIAKERIFESMREGVVVVDSAGRIVDFNESVSRMIPGLTTASVGEPLADVWPRLTGAALPALGAESAQQEMVWTVKGAEGTYQVRSSLVRGRAGVPLGSLLMLIDVTEQKRLQDKLKQQAYYDGLTKLLNRARFIQRSRDLLENARRFDQCVSFVLFDIDAFKRINDTFGHDAGDRAIVHVVEVAKRQLAPDALFARYGGEEFVVALPAAELAEATAVAERIRAALETTPFSANEDGERIDVTASFGVAAFGAGETASGRDALESLLRDADAALYRAKRDGRNLVRAGA